MSRRPGNHNHVTQQVSTSANSIVEEIGKRLREIERISPLEDIMPDRYALRLLRELSEIRDFASSRIRAAADVSLNNGDVSDTQIALAAGMSNSTIGKWRHVLQAAQTVEGEGDQT